MDAGTVSSWVAAAVSVGSLFATLWVRERDRPEADLVLGSNTLRGLSARARRDVATFAGMSDRSEFNVCVIANDGDGPAHRVAFDGEWIDCAIAVVPDPNDTSDVIPWKVYPRIAPAEAVFVFIWRKPGAEKGPMHARWRMSPTRHGRDAECWIDLDSPPAQGKLSGRRMTTLLGHIRR